MSRRGVVRGSVAAVVASAWAGSETRAQGNDQQLIPDALVTLIETWMEELAIPGAAIGVASGDQQQSVGFGIGSIDDPSPVTHETRFQIGSISKTVTSTAIMRLIEDGLVDLDDPVQRFIPDFTVADADVAAEVTVRHLVTHTSGFDVFPALPGTSGDTALQLLMDETSAIQQVAPPGGPFSYTNLNAAILGRILEVVGDGLFEDLIQTMVFDPLDMTTATYDTETVTAGPHARGHDIAEDGTAVVSTGSFALPRITWPTGGIFCSIDDLLRYGMYHAGIGVASDALPGKSARESMQRPLEPGGSLGRYQVDGVGVSWFTVDRDGITCVLHDGGTNGQQSLLVVVPESGFVCAVVANASTGVELAALVARWLLNNLLDSRSLDDEPGTPLMADEFTDCFGTYRSLDGTTYIVETAFVADGPPRITVIEEATQTPVFLDSLKKDVWFQQNVNGRQYIDFVRNEIGEVGWMRIAGRLVAKAG
ncbi:MAG: serine hydrolase domain-containing protein [Thermomicrobiales bacterium]